jgi:hypothetical protein
MTWRQLFDIVIVQARKPDFWGSGTVMTEIVSDDGLMRACTSCKKGGVFYGGSAKMVQDALGISGDRFLYVGMIHHRCAHPELYTQVLSTLFSVQAITSTLMQRWQS